MNFVKTTDWHTGAKALTKQLTTLLADGKRVLWLTSGGSNIAISVDIMQHIPDEDTKNLIVAPIDERYGAVGHNASNAKQLFDAGFQTKEAIFIPALAAGFSLDETKERYSEASKTAFEHADAVIAQIGMGSDGHIAGILPSSPAVDADSWVAAYETPTFNRVTLTFTALKHVTTAYVFAYGADKQDQLLNLRDESLPLAEQPAQFLKQLSEVYIYNDQIGDKS